MNDFFISYNKADSQFAEWIAWQLEKAGYQVVIQAWDFPPGSNFVLEMQRAVEQAERTIIVLSPAFLASQFTAPEWAVAFARDPTGVEGRLLPVRVRECQPKGLLAQVNYIDLAGLKSRDAARQRLLDGIGRHRAKPLAEPDLPGVDPGLAGSASTPEPPWPPSFETAARVVRSVFWRAMRFSVVCVCVALAVLGFIAKTMPEWYVSNPGAAYSTALIWGLLAALLTQAASRVWHRTRWIRPRDEGTSS